jgi:polysaccharide pyruvyl transferase WcaK-like protein
VIKDLESLIRNSLPIPCDDSLMCPPVSSFDDLLSAIAQTDIVVASRFHGIIISLLMARPVIGLSYNQKTDELMADMGLGGYVADIGRFEVPWLVSQLERLQADAEDVRCGIKARRSDYRSALEIQYSLLLGETRGVKHRLAPQSV